MGVEKPSDELCVGVKGQSNSEIARTPRNAFRCSLGSRHTEVERPIGCEGFAAYQVLTNSECRGTVPGSEGVPQILSWQYSGLWTQAWCIRSIG